MKFRKTATITKTISISVLHDLDLSPCTRNGRVIRTTDLLPFFNPSSFHALLGRQHIFRQQRSGNGMFCGTGWFAGKCFVGIDKAVNRMHYLRSAVSTSLSPVAGEKEGRSYLRRADNLQGPHRADPACPVSGQHICSFMHTFSSFSTFQCGGAHNYRSCQIF